MVPPEVCFERDRLGVGVLNATLLNTWLFASFISRPELLALRATRRSICVSANPVWRELVSDLVSQTTNGYGR